MGEFDSVDDELFSERLDYVAAPDPIGEQATVRLEERAPAAPAAFGFGAYEVAFEAAFEPAYDRERTEERDPILLVALGGLLVLVLISTGVVLWWFS